MDPGTVCDCDTTIGVRSCRGCGCSCEPWWSGLNLSIGWKAQDSGTIVDFLSDYYPYTDDRFFPATKEKIMQSLSETYGMDNTGAEGQWMNQNLPQRIYNNPDDIVFALISTLPVISWDRAQQTELIWKYPTQKFAFGQKLLVAQDQQVVMMTADGKKACDSFSAGNYILSKDNCPITISNSRKVAPEIQARGGISDGFPVFINPCMEFETELMVSGQTRALRRIVAKGVARFRISNPNTFLEQIASKGKFDMQTTLSTLRKHCEELLQKEMSLHEFEELKDNSPLLEISLSRGIKNIGLDSIKVSFSWVGEMGPGMFGSLSAATMSQMFDPQRMAQMRQIAETMRAMQMSGKGANLSPSRTYSQQQGAAQTGKVTMECPSCNASNPTGNKFCNNCGKPLAMQITKKVCPKCGEQADASIKFCGNCGTKLP
jgi:hypothetical protein